MNVEDSYEGAVRRLNRLQHAGLDLTPPPEPDDQQRMRDLEQLATLACDENERLSQELSDTRGELGRLMQELDDSRSDSNQLTRQIGGARGENERLTRELNLARGEIERQQRLSATLQEMLSSAQSEAPADDHSHELARARGEIERLQQLVATLQEMLSSAQDEEPLMVKPSGRGPLFWLFAVGAVGGVAAFFLMLRPSPSRPLPAMAAAVAYQPSAPVVAPPAPPPVVVAPAAPKVEPTVPKIAAPIPKVEAPKVVATRRKHAVKHHAAKTAKHEQKHKSVGRTASRGDDPLEGLNL